VTPPPIPAAGEQASALLQEAGLDTSTSRLVDAFSRQPTLQLAGARSVTALSSQMQWTEDGPLSALLLSATSPGLVLPPQGVGRLQWLLRGQLVVTAAALPPGFLAALLATGARGVVCRADASSNGASDSAAGAVQAAAAAVQAAAEPAGSVEECSSFFAAFYEALLGGTHATKALEAAEAQVPRLRGAFVLHSPAD